MLVLVSRHFGGVYTSVEYYMRDTAGIGDGDGDDEMIGDGM